MSRRVHLVLPSFGAGGAERVAVTLANHLLATAWAPTLVTLDSGDGPLRRDVLEGVRVVALDRGRLRSAIAPLIRLVRDERPDAVLSTHAHVNLALAAVRPLLPPSTLLLLREPLHVPAGNEDRGRRVVRSLQGRLYRRADLVLATSRAMADDLAELTDARVVLLPNPVDVARLRVRAEGPTADTVTGRRFVAVARLVPQKAVADLLHAFAEGGREGDELLVIGDGPERGMLERLALTLATRGAVRFVGRSDAPWRQVAQADALVIASRLEGMPNAALEALALGTPVLAGDDLPMLRELAAATMPRAVTIVPRSHLGSALAAVPARTVQQRPAPSLLPDAHDAAAVAASFVGLLADAAHLRDGRHGSVRDDR